MHAYVTKDGNKDKCPYNKISDFVGVYCVLHILNKSWSPSYTITITYNISSSLIKLLGISQNYSCGKFKSKSLNFLSGVGFVKNLSTPLTWASCCMSADNTAVRITMGVRGRPAVFSKCRISLVAVRPSMTGIEMSGIC